MPHVTTHRRIINTAEKDAAEIVCVYESFTPVKVLWNKNGRVIANDQDQQINGKYTIQHNSIHKNTSRLVVNSVTKSDLGSYECVVKNSLGGASAKIELTYVPEPPHLTESSQNNDEVTTHWSIRSLNPLTEVEIHYKKGEGKDWINEKMIDQEHHSGLWK